MPTWPQRTARTKCAIIACSFHRAGRIRRSHFSFVRVNRQRYFHYTALDGCTRFRVLRLYRHLNRPKTSLTFFRQLREAMPFPMRRLQCDGTEFPLEFD